MRLASLGISLFLNGVFLEIQWPKPRTGSNARLCSHRGGEIGRHFGAVHLVPTEMAPYPACEAWPQKEHITPVSVSL